MLETKFKRMSDESVDSYIYRICRNKEIGLYDLTWQQVAEILNSELNYEFTESKYRKEYQAMQRGIDMINSQKAETEDLIEELRKAKIELALEKKKVQTENIYTNRMLREHGREELLKEKVVNAIQNADKIPLPEFKPLQKSTNDKVQYVLGFSDVHAYKIFKSLTNEYSKAILEQRMAKLLKEVVEEIENNNIENLIVLNGGDDLEGILRASALSILELGVQDTVIEYRRFMAKWLSDLSKHVKVKYIQVISSNHTEHRPLNTRAGQFPKEDFEKDIATYIQDILSENDRIEVIVPETAHYHLNILGQDILIHHGHGIGNPKEYLDSMSRKLKVWFSSLILGHLHTEEIKSFYEDIDGGDVEMIRLPSVVGSCDYSDKINKGSKPAAIMLRYKEGKGRDREYKFILT